MEHDVSLPGRFLADEKSLRHVGDVGDLFAGIKPSGKIRHGAFSHSVDNHVGLGIKNDRRP